MSEKSVCQAWASVMVYDEQMKKWKPAGTSQGIARVCIYKREGGQPSYRVVGRKEPDHEVVINCSIVKTLKYNRATMTFHQWRDVRTVYGLNFRTPDDAETFAQGMETAIAHLSDGGGGSMQAEEEARRREQQRQEEARLERERQEAERQKREREQLQQRQEAERRERERQARERASSVASTGSAAPAAPPPPPAPPAPPPPPPAPTPAAAPARPSGGGGGGGGGQIDMASALAAVKLKKAEPVDEKPAGGGGGGGLGGGGGDFLGELQKRMAAKRANKSDDGASKPSSGSSQSIRAEPKRPSWQKSTSQSGSATLGTQNSADRSPTVGSGKRYSGGTTTTSNRVGSTNSLNGNSGDLESLKQEILTEVRTEIRKMKEEIILAIRQELSNR